MEKYDIGAQTRVLQLVNDFLQIIFSSARDSHWPQAAAEADVSSTQDSPLEIRPGHRTTLRPDSIVLAQISEALHETRCVGMVSGRF